MTENNYDIITLLDETLAIQYRSPSAYRITGWSNEEIKDIANLPLIHPDDRQAVTEIMQEVRKKTDTPVHALLRMRHKQGHYVWLEGMGRNLLHDENVQAIVFNFRDVTERMEFEKKLIASEERFRHSLDNMLEGVQIISFDWRYLYVNDAMARHGKYEKHELVGYTVMEKYPGIEQTDIYQVYLRCFNERVAIHLENEFVFPDGSIEWFELSFLPVPEGIFILSVDITDRKKAEARLIRSEQLYRNLFENMLHGFAYCKAIYENDRVVDYTYLAVNSELEAITGVGNITGKKVSEIVPGLLEADPSYAAILTRVTLSGKPERFESYVAPVNKWLSVSIYSPEKGFFVALIDNITERKKAEQEIQRINAELEERVALRTQQLKKTNEELEAFSYSVSHDLRAPLRAIIGFTAILEEEYSSKLDQEAKRLTSVIKSNTQKMGTLIDDLLAFSRMGRHDIQKIPIDTNKQVKQIVEELEQKRTSAVINWIIHPLPASLGDINMLRQVWINLIANAIKYSATNKAPKIEIGAYPSKTGPVYYVCDNGVGFDEKYKDKLFKVFQRLHSTYEFEGTGIGLAIVEKIIAKHGGKVWAEGEVNKGASFYFMLPQEEQAEKKLNLLYHES